MSINLKGLFYSFLMVLSIGLVITAILWLFTDGLNYEHIPIIAIVIVVFSPRFEVVTSQSGKSLQLKGLSIMIFNTYKNWKRRRKNK